MPKQGVIASSIRDNIRILKKIEKEISQRIDERTAQGEDFSEDTNILNIAILHDSALSGVLGASLDEFGIDFVVGDHHRAVISHAREFIDSYYSSEETILTVYEHSYSASNAGFGWVDSMAVAEFENEVQVREAGGCISTIVYCLGCMYAYIAGGGDGDQMFGKRFFDGMDDMGN